MYIGTTPPDYITNLNPYIVPESIAVACLIAYQVAAFPTGFVFQLLKWVHIETPKGGPRSPEDADLVRAGKPFLGVLTMLMDMVKGPFAIIAGITFGALFLKSYVIAPPNEHVCIPELSLYMLFLPPLASLLGHQYPLWFRFRGGKGFAVALSIYAFLNPTAGLAATITWITVLLTTRYFSLAAIVSTLTMPIWGWLFAIDVWLELPDITSHFAVMSSVLAALVLFKYRENIERLQRGTEPKWDGRIPLHLHRHALSQPDR